MHTIWVILKRALEEYGASVTLTEEGVIRDIAALITPVSRRDKAADNPRTPFGEVDDGHYLYIGPPGETLSEKTAAESGGERFDVLRTRLWSLGGVPVYRWAVLRKR